MDCVDNMIMSSIPRFFHMYCLAAATRRTHLECLSNSRGQPRILFCWNLWVNHNSITRSLKLSTTIRLLSGPEMDSTSLLLGPRRYCRTDKTYIDNVFVGEVALSSWCGTKDGPACFGGILVAWTSMVAPLETKVDEAFYIFRGKGEHWWNLLKADVWETLKRGSIISQFTESHKVRKRSIWIH